MSADETKLSSCGGFVVSPRQDSDINDEKGEFEDAGQGKQLSLLGEFLVFVVENKKWWLIPILLVLALFGLIIILASTGAAPFIYTLT
jgi:hypothetical protein